MEKVIIENGYFAREADPRSEIDRALLEKAEPGRKQIFEELDKAAKERIALYMDEMAKAGYIVSRPKAYERDLFNRYTALSATLFVLTRWKLIRPIEPISEDLMPMVYELKRLREKLVPLHDPEKDLWYIWGDDMPHKCVAAEADWRLAFDSPDFRPFLIPYLLDDQSCVKGNILVVSGGGYDWRSNRWEGYEAVHRFNELGYNSFLLQRRVAPYVPLDGAMDLQRSIRFLRANAEKLGIGAADRIAVNGYSGGGMCICDMLAYCYENATPDEIYPDYVPDAIDALSGKADAAILIYGAAQDKEEIEKIRNNPSLPPVFMVTGQRDFAAMDRKSAGLYLALKDLTSVELHIFAETGHGFGVGPCEDVSFADRPVEGILKNAAVWPELADTFLKNRFGLEKSFIPKGGL